MVELTGLQQQVTKGKRPFHLHLMLMECTFTSFETSQLEGSYVGDLTVYSQSSISTSSASGGSINCH